MRARKRMRMKDEDQAKIKKGQVRTKIMGAETRHWEFLLQEVELDDEEIDLRLALEASVRSTSESTMRYPDVKRTAAKPRYETND